jgi:hypothetical protein
MTISPFRPYTIIDALANMPSSVRSPYRHARLWQTDGANAPTNVSTCKNGKTVSYSGKLHAGGKHRDAFSDWMQAAVEKRDQLNDAHEIELMIALHCAPWAIEAKRK